MTSALRVACFAGVALLTAACSKEPPAPAAKQTAAPASKSAAPLRVAYSDWPGWVAWEIGIQKGWFKEAGVDVDFKWFEYVPSMEAFSAGKVDAVTMTNGDMLVTGASGAKSVAILVNDFSNGNDMVVAQPAIKNMAALKGKQVGVEVGFVSHLLLIKALESAGLKDTDVQLVNVPTDQTPQLLRAGEVSAVVAWQPNSGQALKEVAGSHSIYTSADAPGLIYDLLCVSPKSLSEQRTNWSKVAQVWFRIADYLQKPENLDEAAKIMAARVGMDASSYKPLMAGTRFLGLAENRARFEKSGSLESLYHSTEVVDAFQAKNGIYKTKVAFADYLDGSLLTELAAHTPAQSAN